MLEGLRNLGGGLNPQTSPLGTPLIPVYYSLIILKFDTTIIELLAAFLKKREFKKLMNSQTSSPSLHIIFVFSFTSTILVYFFFFFNLLYFSESLNSIEGCLHLVKDMGILNIQLASKTPGQISGVIYLLIRPSCTTQSSIFKMTSCGLNPSHRQTYTLLSAGT